MKEIKGYLIDRTTGLGVSGKTVTFKDQAGIAIATETHSTVWQEKDSVTQADGSFHFSCDLSPGPIQVFVDVSGTEKKVRKFDEKAQLGIQWASDVSRLGRIAGAGVVKGFLNELALSINAGNIRVATGEAIIDGSVWNLEHGVSDTGYYTVAATANGGGSGINPRLDLVTARQYKESAAAQDSGRQDVIVTLGTVSNVLPAVPTGAGFTDLPLGVISTPAGGSPSVAVSAYPSYTGGSGGKAPILGRLKGSGSVAVPSAYSNLQTVTASNLNPSYVYDGEIVIQAVATAGNSMNMGIMQDVNNANVTGGTYTDQPIFEMVLGASAVASVGSFTFTVPLSNVTGVSTFSYIIRLKRMPGTDGTTVLQYWDHQMTLRPRP